ncbi:MAG: hypothetical protein ACFFD8_04980 [Candidatus Thorarchaeota archaeon]
MDMWKVVCDDGFYLQFFVLDGSIKLTAKFLVALRERIGNQEHYTSATFLQYVKAPNGEQAADILAYVLSGSLAGKKKHLFRILFTWDMDKIWRVIGAAPAEFAEAVQKDDSVLAQTLGSLIREPHKWKDVAIVGMMYQPDFLILSKQVFFRDQLE